MRFLLPIVHRRMAGGQLATACDRVLDCTNQGSAPVRAAAVLANVAIAPDAQAGEARLHIVEALLDHERQLAEAAVLALRPPQASPR